MNEDKEGKLCIPPKQGFRVYMFKLKLIENLLVRLGYDGSRDWIQMKAAYMQGLVFRV